MKNIMAAMAVVLVAWQYAAAGSSQAEPLSAVTRAALTEKVQVPEPVREMVEDRRSPEGNKEELRFRTTLKGKETGVTIIAGKNWAHIADGKILVGTSEFQLDGQNEAGYSGSRRLVQNGTVKVDENIQIVSIAGIPGFLTDPSTAAKEMGFSNWVEVRCASGDMLMAISDNKTMKLWGNCISRVRAGDAAGMAARLSSKIMVTPVTANWKDTVLIKFARGSGLDMVMHVLDSVDLSPAKFFDNGDGYLVRVDIADAKAPARAARAARFSAVESVQVNRTVYAMLEGGDMKAAWTGFSGRSGPAGRATALKEIRDILASGPLPGGCALEVNSLASSAFEPVTGDSLNIGIIKAGEFTDMLMVGLVDARSSQAGTAYSYESVSCPADGWFGKCERNAFALETDGSGRVVHLSMEKAKEKGGLAVSGWKVTSSLVCRQ